MSLLEKLLFSVACVVVAAAVISDKREQRVLAAEQKSTKPEDAPVRKGTTPPREREPRSMGAFDRSSNRGTLHIDAICFPETGDVVYHSNDGGFAIESHPEKCK